MRLTYGAGGEQRVEACAVVALAQAIQHGTSGDVRKVERHGAGPYISGNGNRGIDHE